jgi:diguanylate cyclase (GGDEF)-like protein/PAS domain S-box-containing protein
LRHLDTLAGTGRSLKTNTPAETEINNMETKSREETRIAALHAVGILDTPPEPQFDMLCRLASVALSAPIALVSFVDQRRIWFKSTVGLPVDEISRTSTFCSLTVEQNRMVVLGDVENDEPHRMHPFVVQAPFVKFYASQPLRDFNGLAIGALSVFDIRQRCLSVEEQSTLSDIATLIQAELGRRTEAVQRKIRQQNGDEMQLAGGDSRIIRLIETSIAAFVGTDVTGRIVDWNASAERLFGWRRDEVLGLDISDMLIPERFRAAHRSGMKAFQHCQQKKVNRRLEVPALRKEGLELMLEMTITSYRQGNEVFLGSFMHDISEKVAAQQALEAKQQQLLAVLETVDVAVVACDEFGSSLLCNRCARDFFGLREDEFPTHESELSGKLFQSDGASPLLPAMNPLLRATNGEAITDTQMCISDGNGRTRLVLASGRPLLGSAKGRLGAVVAFKDVTDLVLSRRRLAESEERMRAVADNLPVLIAYMDRDLRYRYANSRYQEWFGVAADSMLGKTVSEALGAEYAEPREMALLACLNGEHQHVESDILISAHRRTINSAFIPHFYEGDVVGIHVLSMDVSDVRLQEQHLVQLARTDTLTQLLNRRGYDIRLAEAMIHASVHGQAIALVYLDIDHFKQINDTLGHASGDQVLAQFAQRLLAVTRTCDTVSRLAGDEFTIILPNVNSASKCERIGLKILDAIRPTMKIEGKDKQVTCSVGIAWTTLKTTASNLNRCADHALYRSKEKGKNCVTVVSAT